ncbi:MAG: SGNH/GDSL hydrolase family protein [Bacteroides sp.]|nr:SGNH/GDSL hydrolase family protein [Bacteroides sp.]MDD2644978.1 SGNH/GDSL hydrolase family protein [Bacteroides sp.]MDD4054898.1 SGNH/GDSL hydrolase family protein [Bacteroides sp.]MDD4719623.1 SGNH/GDSL hydrolase family protein [Bacteroides sp.]
MIQRKLILFLFCIISLGLKAQYVYHNAEEFPLYGKISDNTELHFERLDKSLKDKVSRPYLWFLSKNTAGLAVRFKTNSKNLAFKWEVVNNATMNHMAPTGIKGLDLYCFKEGKWKFVNCARPSDNHKSEAVLSAQKEVAVSEYMVYLPLYDGIKQLEIGVDSLAFIADPEIESPRRDKSIVWYGTSIAQGGCASRPGMAHTNILSRWLDCEIFNLGFSGNGQLDYEIAEFFVQSDASLFVLDCMPNVWEQKVYENLENFYNIIRAKHPTTPILFVQNPWFSLMEFDEGSYNSLVTKDKALDEVYAKIKNKDPNVYYHNSKDFLGDDGEATVDGIHYTDLGFHRCAEAMYPMLKKILYNK